ncbi:nitrous oxide reductase accessory protein NosL [Roseovarius mucosus]|uniref:nitrous oxide reductase accessory protein NosL n=1 Tax=Roseovarius mucosus TaxID=215743 RepID=UPI0035CFAA0F|tara:strand:- start:293 stop:865 length:573 start_codon:yes stop_codon:yes gene_type:complete
MKWLPFLFLLLALAACKEEVATRPDPVPLTAEATGHYCQMDLLEHPGPKAQVHLEGLDHPLFFSQVRDAIAYQRMPEQSHAITAIYVNDMAAAASWDQPGAENWIDATSAHYVVGSTATGGMDAPELVPFLEAKDAAAFADTRGGHVLRLAEVADTDVLSAVPIATGISDRAEDEDFEARLKHLSRERQN